MPRVLPQPSPQPDPEPNTALASTAPQPLTGQATNEPTQAAPQPPLPLKGAGFTQDPEEDEESFYVGVATAEPPQVAPPELPVTQEPLDESLTLQDPAEPPVEEPPAWLEEPEWDSEPDPAPGPAVQVRVVANDAAAPLSVREPSIQVQVAPAAPASSQEFPWERFVAEAGRSLGQGIQALLKQASPLEWNAGRLEVQCSNSIAFARRKEELESLATGLTGVAVKLQFQEGQQNAGNSIGNREREAKRQQGEELQAQALAHPLVQEVLTRFPGAWVQEIIIEEKENDV